jgi:hypothetical protein
MSLQEVLDERRNWGPAGRATGAQHVFRTGVTVSGAGGSRIANSSSSAATTSSTDMSASGMSTTMSTEYAVVYTEAASSARDYDPAFVASVLRADAAPPEAAFNNVVDMLDWLNRD